jgi:hypothetical protein
VVRVELDAKGRIKQVHTILATDKIARVPSERLRQMPAVVSRAALGVRRALGKLQPGARKISPHLQVHPRSRARRKVSP